jgi:hypothetical protein
MNLSVLLIFNYALEFGFFQEVHTDYIPVVGVFPVGSQ